MLPYHRKLLSAVGGGGFAVQAVTFDGSNDYLMRGADLTGNADDAGGTVSFWINVPSLAQGRIIHINDSAGAGAIGTIELTGAGAVRIVFTDTGGGTALNMYSDTALSTGAWHHVLASWNASGTLHHIYVDDTDDIAAGSSMSGTNFDYTGDEFSIAADDSGGTKFTGDLAEVYFENDYIDISVEANRRKFIDASGKPVFLGADGSLPTGSSPLVFLSGEVDSWHTNKGTGGGFTENGTLTDAATSPSY